MKIGEKIDFEDLTKRISGIKEISLDFEIKDVKEGIFYISERDGVLYGLLRNGKSIEIYRKI